jgi:prevent-host-death family protein
MLNMYILFVHEGRTMMITVTATDFKAKCLALIDEMNRTKVPIVVTNRGKRVAEMYPARSEVEADKPFIGSLKDSVLHYDGPFVPVLEEGEWNAMS